MTKQEAHESNLVIQGIKFIKDILTHALFDTGAAYSFITPHYDKYSVCIIVVTMHTSYLVYHT